LIVSLWKVADEPTAELMTQFYRELDSSQQPAAALKKAQMALRSKRKDSYFWAAFICIGDPGVT
jgi:CHAT domain-containing protein